MTTDLANLWRAEEAGLLEPVTTPALQQQVPQELRDAQGAWWGLSVRVRTPVRSTERVPEDAIRGYEDLGDTKFRGKLCLRTSNNEYNQSLVADRIAKHGAPATEKLLRSWMANKPQILGSDVDVLEAIEAGRCDVGLTNHYYLARELEEQPQFPVAPAWPDQDGDGAHANLSGVGLVKGSEHRRNAVALMEHLTSPDAQREIAANGEFAANTDVPPAEHIADWADVKLDPIDVERGRQAAARGRRAHAAGRVAVAAEPVTGGGRRRRPAGWSIVGALVALVVAGPLIALPLAFLRGDEALDQISASLLPEALRNSVILAAGVGVGTLVIGGAMAALVSFYDFPGRRWLDWALILPLAVPAYVLVFVLLGQYDDSSTLQQGLRAVFGDDFRLPEIRSTAGTIAVLTAVLYPYVYALGRGGVPRAVA